MWYSQFEYQRMRYECHVTISKIRENIPEDESNCYRGFEWKANGAPTRRKAIRKRAQSAVFGVQDGQWDADEYTYNPEAIAAAYSSYTGCCNFEAFRRGLEDAEQVHGAYYTVRDQQVNPLGQLVAPRGQAKQKKLKFPFGRSRVGGAQVSPKLRNEA
jgi:hypothetical protein